MLGYVIFHPILWMPLRYVSFNVIINKDQTQLIWKAKQFPTYSWDVPLVSICRFYNCKHYFLLKKSCNSKGRALFPFCDISVGEKKERKKKVHSILKHIFRKCMLISYEIAEGAQLRTGSLKRSFVVQNKLHGRQNNACGAEKMCLEEKRH